MSLATRLNQLRLRSGESLQDVANAVGISKTHIWELEKGRSQNPSIELLGKIADHFKVTIRSLVGEDMESGGGDEELMRMFRLVGQLDERERGMLDDMILSMISRRKKINDSD